jgi:hypothetical protein
MARKTKAKGPGRPPLPDQERREVVSVRLRKETVEQARAIGGNVTRGIEMSVTEYWAGIQPAKPKREK